MLEKASSCGLIGSPSVSHGSALGAVDRQHGLAEEPTSFADFAIALGAISSGVKVIELV
jgi:hypothetical protein